ncbi:MAG: hypothetical protein JW709_11240, partial [Sedimentisphaerales bacterium]|nr:hypothetical protein [Sedimentisphaerales bacterium]
MQRKAIRRIVASINEGKDLLIDKSRDMGATWIVLGTFFAIWLLFADSHFLCASRKEEYVDKRGDHKCLFSKLIYLHKRLPDWMKPEIEKTHMHLRNLWNESVIDGESTNKDLGAGDRRLAVMLDEFARVDPADAASISETLSDTTDCIIYNSTHTHRGHPYAKLRFSGKVDVFVLPWWKRPERITGLYRSPDYGKVIIEDINYYRRTYGGDFLKIEKGELIDVKALEIAAVLSGEDHALFVADGSGKWRSVWYDDQCRRRSDRDVAQNLDMDPVGSGDMAFEAQVLQRMRSDLVKEPDFTGEILYRVLVADDTSEQWERDRIVDVRFRQDIGKKRLQWWGRLFPDIHRRWRPDQTHNYIVGCDISLGSGSSNSVASIYDCNLNQKVGSWVCPFTSPTHFAEQVVALCLWVGGASNHRPFLIWESNGAGTTFGRRIYSLGYDFVYYRADETKTFRPRSQNRGWHNSSATKLDLIINYREALGMVFRLDDQNRRFVNPDEDAIREAEDYIFLNASTVGPSCFAEEEGGAKAAHGDRVIADALCCLARQEQLRAVLRLPRDIPADSYAARREEWEHKSRFN